MPRDYVRISRVTAITRALCIISLLALLLWRPWGATATAASDLLSCAQIAGAVLVLAHVARSTRGTRRTLFASLTIAAACALVGRGWSTGVELALGRLPAPPIAESTAGIAASLAVLVGFVIALGRWNHRNWMRFEALVDALLLIVAATIVVVGLDAATATASHPGALARALTTLWNVLAAGSLVLVVLLLVWRGDALGSRLATGLAIATVALGLASFLYSRAVLLDGAPVPRLVFALWTLTALVAVSAGADPAASLAASESRESPMYASDTAKVRAISVGVAILAASWSAAALGMHGAMRPTLGVSLAVFGTLIAVRAGYAMFTQQRATVVLEHVALAERELSTTLEQRVALRTQELGEAHRVLQRMWALGQQVALELTPERVLPRFLEAAIDVLRADGAAVGFLDGERVSVPNAVGICAPLADASLATGACALGRVARGEGVWSASDLRTGAFEEDLVACAEARACVVVPLLRRGDRVGAVLLAMREPRAVSAAEIAPVEAMADFVSVALANAVLVETLRQAEWRFRTLFRAAPDAVLTVFESGRIREANDAAGDLVGRHSMQLVGGALEDLVLAEDRAHVRSHLAQLFEGVAARFEARFRHDHGIRIVSLAARRLPEADPPMALLVGRDVTTEREMRARLSEAERLAAVGELVAGVAHEVNNPLSTISAFAQLLERDSLSPEQRESVEVIRSETMRASQVLRDLLAFARRPETSAAPLQLNELVERTVRLQGYELLTHGIEPVLRLEPELPLVHGDARQLQQVLLNLVSNAVQAMAPQRRGQLRLTTRFDGGRVLLEVGDTGPGIEPDVLSHIFEAFYTTKRDGTGLGLSVSYGIIAAHGGTIAVAESASDGTTFRVALPALPVESDAGGDDDASHVSPHRRRSPLAGVRMLFVDDEPTLRAGVQAFAKLRGFTVTPAPDGVEALASARRETFDVVVCDLRMPGMDGATFFEKLRQEQPALASRTLFITGDLASAASRAFLGTVSQPVLTKPFDLDRLEESVAALLTEAALDPETPLASSDTLPIG